MQTKSKTLQCFKGLVAKHVEAGISGDVICDLMYLGANFYPAHHSDGRDDGIERDDIHRVLRGLGATGITEDEVIESEKYESFHGIRKF